MYIRRSYRLTELNRPHKLYVLEHYVFTCITMRDILHHSSYLIAMPHPLLERLRKRLNHHLKYRIFWTSSISHYKTTCAVLDSYGMHPYYTSWDFPELSAYYSLTPVALISGKVFYRILLVGCVSCLVEKQVRSDSNAYLAVLKTAVFPIKLPTYQYPPFISLV